MNKMTGIILMIAGALIFIGGIFVYSTSKKSVEQTKSNNELEKVIEMAIADGVLTENERKIIKQTATANGLVYDDVIADVEKQISEQKTDSETEIIDYKKKKGDDFEKFIIQKFDSKYFRIKEWAGDKYVKGIYAETTQQPDILLEFNHKKESAEFWVECKWRQERHEGGIKFAYPDQYKRYKKFETDKNIPVFIAIGVGGKAGSPEKLYIVPLQKINSNFIAGNELDKFEKKVKNNFFFDIKTQELK